MAACNQSLGEPIILVQFTLGVWCLISGKRPTPPSSLCCRRPDATQFSGSTYKPYNTPCQTLALNCSVVLSLFLFLSLWTAHAHIHSLKQARTLYPKSTSSVMCNFILDHRSRLTRLDFQAFVLLGRGGASALQVCVCVCVWNALFA